MSLQWKWFLGLAALLIALLLVINVAIGFFLPSYLSGKIQEDLERNAVLAREALAARLPVSPAEMEELNASVHDLASHTGLRITVIAPDGTVIGESDKPFDQLGAIENHRARPEIQDALLHSMGVAKRYSATIDVDLLYVAVAVYATSDRVTPVGVVRVALPLHAIAHTVGHVRRIVAGASAAVILAALPVMFWLSRKVSGPILHMSDIATRLARGDFSARAPSHASGELGVLAVALNDMSMQLETRLRELTLEKAEVSAILASMAEGVLVVDAAGKIRLANTALCQQFRISGDVAGMTLLEAFRNAALQKLADDVAGGHEIAAREMIFPAPSDQVFEVSAAQLRGIHDSPAGLVVVFHNITRLKQLENIRKEFVANVSHELRTPLSMIKGYVETLLDEQQPDGTTARRFMETIQKHALRLETLIEDLLAISSLESQQARMNLSPVDLRAAATAAAEELEERARTKSISVSIEIPGNFSHVRADATRLHQVFLNLLDNAIKYSQSGASVSVTAHAVGNDVDVVISDNGPGIAAEHLSHIFERFYRVDRARSRELGGTGLGLSIVKHIVQAHGGRVWAESAPGKGSAFHFTLSRA